MTKRDVRDPDRQVSLASLTFPLWMQGPAAVAALASGEWLLLTGIGLSGGPKPARFARAGLLRSGCRSRRRTTWTRVPGSRLPPGC
jgi:hypothetical protein